MDPDDAPMSDHPRIVAVLFYRERVMDLLFCPSSLTYQRQISETLSGMIELQELMLTICQKEGKGIK